jgi:hypothetical protein
VKTLPTVDLGRLRAALRRMSRGDLLIVAERAAEFVPKARLRALVDDLVRLEELTGTNPDAPSLLGEVREFHAAALRGEYYESFDVNSKNFREKSKGTQAFIAEFARLLRDCTRAAARAPRGPVREAFDLLFGLLRHIDECHDDVIFFADEAGSWQVGVDWRSTLPACFRCLADGASAEEYAREVDRIISTFADHDRPWHLAAAGRVANAEQRAALGRLPGCGARP